LSQGTKLVTLSALVLPDGSQHVLAGAALTIGRSPDSDIVLRAEGVSRQHARLICGEGRWFLEDRGSLYGTFLNGMRLPLGATYLLRHADRVLIGSETLIFVNRGERHDPDETAQFDTSRLASRAVLSPFQQQVVNALCRPWLAGASFAELPSNEDIALSVGTPGATGSVKAALRRIYAKAGLHGDAPNKRGRLCEVARRQGWI
jgi:pSer/pThr/pTyr-binding forkhead associated (FHA) protein